MMKFFCKISRNHTTYVRVGGVERRVVFDNSVGNGAGFGEFVTDDEGLADAMKQDVRYGVDWFCADVAVDVAESEADGVVLERMVVKTLNEAIDWLLERGCVRSKVSSSSKAVAAAKGLGYELMFDKE